MATPPVILFEELIAVTYGSLSSAYRLILE